MSKLNVNSNMRVGAIGRTRSGKTFMMGKLLEAQPRVICIDSKHRVRWPGFHLTKKPEAALAADKVILRPEGKIPDSFWFDAFESLQERGGGIVYLDEAPEVTSANYIPQGVKTIVRLGGEVGVGLWWASQEATGVNNTLIRQSEILMLFLNQGASDRDKLIQTCGDMGEATSDLELWEFMVYQGYGKGYDPANIPVYKWEADK